jgi:hypothetical protein
MKSKMQPFLEGMHKMADNHVAALKLDHCDDIDKALITDIFLHSQNEVSSSLNWIEAACYQ